MGAAGGGVRELFLDKESIRDFFSVFFFFCWWGGGGVGGGK